MTDIGLVDERAVAQRLGTSTRHVRDLRYSGALAYLRIGGKIRFDPAEVEAFVDRARTDAFLERTRAKSGVPAVIEDPQAAERIARALR